MSANRISRPPSRVHPYDSPITGATHGELLKRAADGDQTAWEALVDQFNQMVWSIARSFRLDEATAKDVTQTVWLRLVENLNKIQDPERLPGWLATTTRREAQRVKKVRERTAPSEFEHDVEDPSPQVDTLFIEEEDRRTVVAAFGELDEGCQQLLRLLTVDPPLSYEEIAELVGRPVGSLGPTRARCIERLKKAMSRISRVGDDSLGQGGAH